jgi:hypothetical protein
MHKCDYCKLLSSEPTSRPPHPALVPDIATSLQAKRLNSIIGAVAAALSVERPLAAPGYRGKPFVGGSAFRYDIRDALEYLPTWRPTSTA